MIVSPEAVSCGVPPKERAASAGRRRTCGVSLARHRDVGTQHLKTTPTASEKRGWGTVGSMCPQCRDGGGRLGPGRKRRG
jgi:hypothetical protein